jgi:methionine-rich copper-binding protein CopC
MATPAPGANLENLPDTIRLVFSEPVKPGAPLAIYNPQFQEVASLAPSR